MYSVNQNNKKAGVLRPLSSPVYLNIKSVFRQFSNGELQTLRSKIFGPEKVFVTFPNVDKIDMQNKTVEELNEVLSTLTVETSGKVSLYKTPNNYYDKSEKPEQTGLVFIDGVFAFSGYPYSIEMMPEDLQKLNFDIVSNSRFFEANEGTVLKVFNVDNIWYTSTNKKIDAFVSKWAAKDRNKTFGCHLAKSLYILLNGDTEEEPVFEDIEAARSYVNAIWTSSLDPTKRYFFLLKSSVEERVVCIPEAKVLNIGVIDANNQLSLDEDVEITSIDSAKKVVVEKPEEHHFSDISALVEKVKNIDPYKCVGLLSVFTKNLSGENIEKNIEKHIHVKIFNPKYKQLNTLRANTPSLSFRYLQLKYLYNQEMKRSQIKPSYVDDFLALYDQENLQSIEDTIWDKIVPYLFNHYQQLYVKREPTDSSVVLPEKTSNILKIIHNEYQLDRASTTLHKISNILNYVTPEQLNQLIREFNQLNKQ